MAITITEEYENTLKLIKETFSHYFISGKAGSGKTTFLHYMLENIDKNFVILAPTGIAAVHAGGQTIHSLFRFPFKILTKDDASKVLDPERRALLENLDAIIIDEVSMVRADLLDAINVSLQVNRRNSAPFGGVQMLFFGDLFQLDPVLLQRDEEAYYSLYQSKYFFDSKILKTTECDFIEFTEVFRQNDDRFKDVLNNVREGKVTQQDLDYLNARFDFEADKYDDLRPTLTAHNKTADNKNLSRLEQLPTPPFTLLATIEGNFPENSYPVPYELVLKEGAQVMFAKNDPNKRFVNGTMGIVIKITKSNITIATADGEEIVCPRAVWEINESFYDENSRSIGYRVVGSYTQFPVKLAWAITIHKSQGQTFPKVIIDLGTGAFAHGQVYTALSRLTSIDGLVLATPINREDIITDHDLLRFFEQMEESV